MLPENDEKRSKFAIAKDREGILFQKPDVSPGYCVLSQRVFLRMSSDILESSGESGAVRRFSWEFDMSASLMPASSETGESSAGVAFSDSKARRFSSTMSMLMTAPMAATRTFTHQGRPRVPIERPAACNSPETVGPNARQALAADAAAPFKVPSTLLEGAELASMMLLDGKAKAWAVTFQTSAT